MSSSNQTKGAWSALGALGITEIIAWGSVYYAFALLMEPLQVSLGASKSAVVGAFSVSLLASGLVTPFIGRYIDRHGGRRVMVLGSALAGVALCALAHVTTLAQFYLAWIALGVAMAATLYEPAFAVLTQAFRANSRKAITVLTLFGGLASTVFWPLTAMLIDDYGWRNAMTILGVVQFAVCMPLHAMFLPGPAVHGTRQPPEPRGPAALGDVLRDPAFYLLCIAFTVNAAVFSGMAVHMLAMLEAKGLSTLQAAFIGAMIGPMQVAGRLVEMLFGQRLSPSKVGVIAMGLLPASLAILIAGDSALAALALFALLYGAGNGVMTIVRGTIPAELYGRANYGAINGAMASPVFLARAAGPLAVAWIWSATGSYDGVVTVLAAISAVSLITFAFAVRRRASFAASFK